MNAIHLNPLRKKISSISKLFDLIINKKLNHFTFDLQIDLKCSQSYDKVCTTLFNETPMNTIIKTFRYMDSKYYRFNINKNIYRELFMSLYEKISESITQNKKLDNILEILTNYTIENLDEKGVSVILSDLIEENIMLVFKKIDLVINNLYEGTRDKEEISILIDEIYNKLLE